MKSKISTKKVHRVIKSNQKAWRKPYIDMNKQLRKKTENEFEKDFFLSMNNAVFGKNHKNVRKHTDIKRVIAKPRNNYLISKSNYHTKKYFKKSFSHRNEKNPNKYS